MVEYYYQQVVSGQFNDMDHVLNEIDQVTKEDIVRVANQVELDTVYFLTAEDGGESHE
ncbi:hypothetical protein [Piscibacillus salipiscarius]|nr:hypothetical protein [Piscibacillus salipiscarius]